MTHQVGGYSAADIDALLPPGEPSSHRVPFASNRLDPWAEESLAVGAEEGSRSHAIIRFASHASSRGWTRDQVESALADPANRLGQKYREPGMGPRWFDHVRRAAEVFAERSEPSVSLQLCRFRVAVTHARLPGRRGASLRRMLLAVAEIAGRSGRCDLIYLSGRELEEVSRISRGTLRRSLLPLAQDLGWLVRVQKGEGAMAPVFDLRVPEDVALWDDPGSWGEHSDLAEREGSVLGVLGGCVCGSDTPLTLHDAFAPGGLTPAAAEVMELLSAVEPSTPKNLADRSGRHVRTVQRALTALRESGLVERIEGGWVRRDRDLEEVASEVGTLGRTTIIRSRHIAQRADFAELRKRQRSTGTEG